MPIHWLGYNIFGSFVISQIEQISHLSEELQLGDKLNQCVHSGERSEFSLLLAMLDEDVRQHSQFSLPKTEITDHEVNTATLRRTFQLPKERPLGLDSTEEINQFNDASLVEQGRLDAIRLQACLNPSAIAFRDDKTHIDTIVVNNLSLHCQKRLKQKVCQQPDRQLEFDAAGWLAGIRETLVASALV